MECHHLQAAHTFQRIEFVGKMHFFTNTWSFYDYQTIINDQTLNNINRNSKLIWSFSNHPSIFPRSINFKISVNYPTTWLQLQAIAGTDAIEARGPSVFKNTACLSVCMISSHANDEWPAFFVSLTEYSQLKDVAFDVLVCDLRFAMLFTTESEHFRGQEVKIKAYFFNISGVY